MLLGAFCVINSNVYFFTLGKHFTPLKPMAGQTLHVYYFARPLCSNIFILEYLEITVFVVDYISLKYSTFHILVKIWRFIRTPHLKNFVRYKSFSSGLNYILGCCKNKLLTFIGLALGSVLSCFSLFSFCFLL